MFDDPGRFLSKWQAHQREVDHGEQSLKVVYVKQSTFNHWNNLKKLSSNKEGRPYSNDDLASSLIELYTSAQ